MKLSHIFHIAACAVVTALAIADPADALAQSIPISETPLFSVTQQPPLNMLVVGKDHKLFYEAYNDASDLNGDGTLDVGYQPTIDYYGYFDSYQCYSYSGGVFTASATTANKKCSGAWSGDFLNYLTTSRIDALRKVLYGGTRSTDSTTQTIIERAYIPQDAHSWGKEYQSVARDGFDIHDYTPYSAPTAGRYLLFANTTLLDSVTNLRNPDGPPLLRVMQNSPFRIWNWVSIERPVAGDDCFTESNNRVNCLTGGGANASWTVVPSAIFSGLTKTQWSLLPDQGGNHSSNEADMNRLFPPNAAPGGTTRIQCGTGSASNIDGSGNQFKGLNGCPNNDDYYLTEFSGNLSISAAGTYQFAIDGDDAVEFYIDNVLVAGWFGPHGDCGYCTTHSGSVTLTAGTHTIKFRHQEINGGDNYRLMWLPPAAAAASRTDYTVRVEVCNATYATHEQNCKKYTNPSNGTVVYKPTGLLHDYGETGKMKFGLLSGSYMHNRQGGVLRKQMGAFTDEVDPATGRFTWKTSGFKGIISTLDGIKINSFERGYSHDYACNNSGWYGPVADGVCRIWGNPIGEMMFETLRYFAGAAAPEPEYTYTDAGSDDATLNMPEVTNWKDPYKTVAQGGLGNLACAKPFETVISDINPEYDSNLPGGAWGGAPSGALPSTLAPLNVGTIGDQMWSLEGGGTRNVYIGQVGGTTDGAPTPKSVSSFGNIRGLSPEEPTKEGSYYSSAVAFFGNTNDVSPTAASAQKMQTFSVAVASPLPKITFPIGSSTMTLVPFAKSVGGNSIDPNGAFQSTDQIVDFYVEKIVNIAGAPTDNTINAGRAYAKFRINYEDIEQGNDHDMDAIVSYEVLANANGTVTVNLNSEYAAGSIVQHMGYVVSGTTADGIYLEVRDVDTGAGSDPRYRLDTPDGFGPGGCSISGSNSANTSCPTGPSLPLSHSRVFTSGSNAPGVLLKDPLWYAAKYGGFKDANGNGIPDEGEWDAKVSGQPDNYFLVTNALGLRAQLQAAFDSIITNSQPVGSAAASGARFVIGGSLAYQAKYLATDWTGDLTASTLNGDGTLAVPPVWSASQKLLSVDQSARKIFTGKPSGTPPTFTGVPFTTAGLTAAMQTQVMTGLDTTTYNITDVLSYLRGDQTKETSHTPPGPYRSRTTKLGDVLDSNPTVQFRTGYGYQNLPTAVNGRNTGSASYATFVANKTGVTVYVGANDGMLHAFDGASTGGDERFAYVPNAVLGKIGRLAQPSYQHTYFVDGTPTLGDIYDGSGWRTVLMGAAGPGARAVFGLDVTNPSTFSASNVLWEFNDQNDTDMGYGITVPSLPTIGADGKWIVAFGNGYNSARNRAELFILDALNGTKLAEIDTNYGGSNTSASCSLASGPTDCPNGLASAVVVDTDIDGVGDAIYAGDYLGNLWKFTCNPDTTALTLAHPVHVCTTPWQLGHGGQPLIQAQDSAGNRQRITSGVYAIHNPLGGTIIYFGTGKYLASEDADPSSSGVNTIYAVWDSPYNASTVLTRASLMQQTVTSVDTTNHLINVSSNLFDYEPAFPVVGANSKMGWFLDLAPSGTPNPIQGERVIASPTAILGELLVNAFRPTGDLCQPGGVNTFFELDLLSGAAALQALPGGGGGGGGGIPPGTGGQDLGTGSPLGSPNPVISIPGVPTVPGIGCPANNPNCRTAPDWCTVGTPGYPNCAPPDWCPGGGNMGTTDCTPPTGCAPGVPGFPYTGVCAISAPQCKWFNPGTVVGNLIACRVSWRQLR